MDNKHMYKGEPVFSRTKELKTGYKALDNDTELREQLKAYKDTGFSPEDIKRAIELLRGKCWACKHGKPYQIGAKHLMTCERMDCVAATQVNGCHFWEYVSCGTTEGEKQYPFGHCRKCGKKFNSELQNKYDIAYCPWCGEEGNIFFEFKILKKKEKYMKKLKKCPFCGGEGMMKAHKDLSGNISSAFVYCLSCDAETHSYTTVKAAKKVWNMGKKVFKWD